MFERTVQLFLNARLKVLGATEPRLPVSPVGLSLLQLVILKKENILSLGFFSLERFESSETELWTGL